MIYKSSPPGYLDATEAASFLGMSRNNFYKRGIAEMLDSWQRSRNHPRLFRQDDVGRLRYWLKMRRALIGLGLWAASEPVANPHWAVLVEEDEWGIECDVCGGEAFINYDEGKVWCEECQAEGDENGALCKCFLPGRAG